MKKFVILFLLAFFLFNISAQEANEQNKPEDILKFQTAQFYNLQKAYNNDKDSVNAPYKKKLQALLQKYLGEANQLYEDKKKSGNIKGMGIARKAKSTFSKALEELKTKGEFTLPPKTRRELQATLNKCRQKQQEILKDVDSKFKELEEKYQQKFKEEYVKAYKEGQAPEDDEINAKFKEFLTASIEKPEAEKKAEADLAKAKELGMEIPKKPAKPKSPIIASQGTGDKWVNIAQWTGDMMGMDMINIPLLNQTKDSTDTQYLPIADADSKLSFKAINPMPEHENYAFRLKRVGKEKGVDVVEWPSPRNDWTLMIRTKPLLAGEKAPNRHAFIFQVSLPDRELKRVFRGKKISSDKADKAGKTATSKKVPKVKIGVLTKPKGANIYVNGEIYKIKGKTVRTPCRIYVPATGSNIKLTYLGYYDKTFENFVPSKKKPMIKALLKKDTSLKSYRKSVSANAPTWTSTGVKLKPGDEVIIQVEGIWQCTKSSKAKCGPQGIPNNTANYKYYADASKDKRQRNSVPYGALLMKLQSKDEDTIRSFYKRVLKFKAPKKAEILFDINEREGKPRKGNKGALNITILVKSKT